MSQISSLEATLAQEKAENAKLHSYMNELTSGVSAANRELSNFTSNVQNTLGESAGRITRSHESIIRAQEIQAEIDVMYARFKQMELANKKIRACNNKKYYDFNNYATVRKIVQGILDNMNLNMISDKIIYKSIEKQHLQTPDYWLTSVLISVMAWKNDDKMLADRAMEISMQLDRKNSAIFYMLFNLRVGRDEAAMKWFLVYQGCELNGSDQRTFLLLFSLLSKTQRDDLNDKIKYEIMEFIDQVIGVSVGREGFSEQEILNIIEYYLTSFKKSSSLNLTMLQRCLGDYSDLADIVLCAENNINILQYILDVGNVSELEKNSFIDQFINEQIASPNPVELEVYDEIAYNELVIAQNGDLEAAKRLWAEKKKHDADDLNLIKEMIQWIYNGASDVEINPQMRKNMYTLTIGLQESAYAQYAAHYRARIRDVHPATLGDYQSQVDFNNRSAESQKITAYYERERDEKLAQIKNTMVIVGAVMFAAGIGLAIFMKSFAWLVLSLAGIGLAVYTILSNNSQKKHLAETCVMNIENKNNLMDQLFLEYAEYKRIFAEYDAYSTRVEEALDQF